MTNFGRWVLVIVQAKARKHLGLLLDWHSAVINPKDMSLPSTLFEALANESSDLRQLLGFHVRMVFTGYTEEGEQESSITAAEHY